MFNLIIYSEKCTGCQACAIACSYHHRKVFSPRIASLKIDRDEKLRRASIVIVGEDSPEQERGERVPCDGCAGVAVPLCVWYCGAYAIATSESQGGQVR